MQIVIKKRSRSYKIKVKSPANHQVFNKGEVVGRYIISEDERQISGTN